ncbi:5-methylcytosine restriction system specificity protein McrC [Agathobacter sp.]
MKQLLIKDNQYRPKSDFCEVRDIVNHIADKTLAELEKEGIFVFPSSVRVSEDLSNDQMILQSYNDKYVSGNVMGFLGVGTQRIVIESRFSRDEKDYFFQYLLEKVLKFPNFINFETSVNQDDRLFSLLLFLFPMYLRDAMRKGLFKTYICRQYNDGNVRGTIDVARHIKKNSPFIGNIAYSNREYSYDNYLMELVRHTIEYIKGKNCGRKLLSTIKDEVNQVIKATPEYRAGNRKRIIDDNIKNVVRHAYYHEYRSLQQLCILILRNEQHQYGNGTQNVYGLLFDGAWLWEEYVNMLIGDEFYHPKNKTGDGAQRLFAGNFGLIYPDFIGKDNNERIIADAKYKPLNNISGKDYLQVLAYMFRFDAKKGYYLYPEADSLNDVSLVLNKGMTYENNVSKREDISVVKCGLHIPNDMRNYTDFIEHMEKNERIFRQKLLC